MTVAGRARAMILFLLTVWGLAVIGGVASLYIVPESGGDPRAMGRFLAWQGAGTVMAVLLAIFGLSLPRGMPWRRVSFVPLGLLVLAIAVLAVLLARSGTPPPGA